VTPNIDSFGSLWTLLKYKWSMWSNTTLKCYTTICYTFWFIRQSSCTL